MGFLLESINSPKELKMLSGRETQALCGEIREFLIDAVSKQGGHLASNLGAVELTVALHRVFDCPKDRFVFDVGHQSYTHKLLTGRRERFDSLRSFGGISGFPKPRESECDAFGAGHSSTSVSAALGIAAALRAKGSDAFTVAVIGDGALTGGLAYEGLNNAGRSGARLLVVINDNMMSISENVGSISAYLTKITSREKYFKLKDTVKKILSSIPLLGKPATKATEWIKETSKRLLLKTPGNFFEDLGFTYFGPIDGHNTEVMEQVFRRVKKLESPCVVHVVTQKGKGYPYAESDPRLYHGVAGFDVKNGVKGKAAESYSEVFTKAVCDAAQRDPRICAITAAMVDGVSFCEFASKYPNRFYDVGIAEGHAVTFAAGLAKEGMRPVFACYSTFLQRAYDQIIHDAALQGLPVIFGVDRAGFVGEDGETHQGLFDVAALSSIPETEIYSPLSYAQLRACTASALLSQKLCAIRYPKGSQPRLDAALTAAGTGHIAVDCDGADIIFITYGRQAKEVSKAAKMLADKGIKAGILLLIKIKPIDFEAVFAAVKGCGAVIFAEEGLARGGIGEQIGARIRVKNYHIAAVGDVFVPQGTVQQQLELCGLDAQSLFEKAAEMSKKDG